MRQVTERQCSGNNRTHVHISRRIVQALARFSLFSTLTRQQKKHGWLACSPRAEHTWNVPSKHGKVRTCGRRTLLRAPLFLRAQHTPPHRFSHHTTLWEWQSMSLLLSFRLNRCQASRINSSWSLAAALDFDTRPVAIRHFLSSLISTSSPQSVN